MTEKRSVEYEQVFDSVFVIQSLDCNEPQTGTVLYEKTIKPSLEGNGLRSGQIFVVANPQELRNRLAEIALFVEKNELSPILQLETHGTRKGIRLEVGSITWEELYEPLLAVNRASRNSLLLCSSMCWGGFALEVHYPEFIHQPCAFWGVVGPSDKVWNGDLLEGFAEFYSMLLGGRGANAALQALGAKVEGLMVTLSERAFLQGFCYYVDYTLDPKDISARVEKIVRETGASQEHVRKRLTSIIEIEADFYKLRAKHLHIAEFPDIADRFESTFSDAVCFNMVRPSGG